MTMLYGRARCHEHDTACHYVYIAHSASSLCLVVVMSRLHCDANAAVTVRLVLGKGLKRAGSAMHETLPNAGTTKLVVSQRQSVVSDADFLACKALLSKPACRF